MKKMNATAREFTWDKDYHMTPGGPYAFKSYWSTESNFCGDIYEPCEEFETYLACIYDENKEDYIAKKEFHTEEEAKTWIENQIN